MRVEKVHPALLDGAMLDVAVVFDVFRATSTATLLLERHPKLWVLSEPHEASNIGSPDQIVVFSERSDSDAVGRRFDNSPNVARVADLNSQECVLMTTNGTRALFAASSAKELLIGSFLNLDALARYLTLNHTDRSVTLLPAGSFRHAAPHIEDEMCADALASLLKGERPKLEEMFAQIRTNDRVRRRCDAEDGLEADIDLCLSPSLCEVVARCEPVGEVMRLEVISRPSP